MLKGHKAGNQRSTTAMGKPSRTDAFGPRRRDVIWIISSFVAITPALLPGILLVSTRSIERLQLGHERSLNWIIERLKVFH
jgi:hypothetical protein